VNEAQAAARLIAERETTAHRIASMTAELSAVAAAAASSNLDDEHDPEGSTVAFEREQLAALRDRAEAQLRELDAALERLAERRYGRCESCGGLIGDERLAVLPATRLCVTCAAKRRR
jgi:RNA polymerase-binding transcription factor DksA